MSEDDSLGGGFVGLCSLFRLVVEILRSCVQLGKSPTQGNVPSLAIVCGSSTIPVIGGWNGYGSQKVLMQIAEEALAERSRVVLRIYYFFR